MGAVLAPRVELQSGSYGIVEASGIVGVSAADGWSLAGAGTLTQCDAERIADRSAVPFDSSRSSQRTNIDLDGYSFFAAAERATENSGFRTSILRANVTRGIAAQGHLDPEQSNPRLWRYPLWRLTQLTASFSHTVSDAWRFRAVGWQQWFAQDIDDYQDVSYGVLKGREEGDDSTTGARVVATHDSGSRTLRLAATAQTSTHRQVLLETDTGDRADLVADPTRRYRQDLFSAGLEFDQQFDAEVTATAPARTWRLGIRFGANAH